MPKQKTHKGTAKRVKVTATGKVIAHKSGNRHLLAHKDAKTKRQNRRPSTLAKADAARMKRGLGV